MKKFSLKTRQFQMRKRAYAEHKQKKISRAIDRRRRLASKANKALPALRIYAPASIELENLDMRRSLLAFLEQLRSGYKNSDGRTLLIDFSQTKRFVSTGTTLLYAELSRLIDYGSGRVRLRCTKPANNQGSQVLEQIGFYKLCSHPSNVKPTRDDVVHWRVARGHVIDNSICAPAIEAFDGQLAAPLVDGILGGLGEAMGNAVEHAYLGTRADSLDYDGVKDWWMFSQARDGYLSVVFCDLGVGIPTTLPIKRPTVYRLLEKLGIANSDSACIEEAIKDSRSRTGVLGRGHGLGEIIDVVEQIPNGEAVVYSNRGCYILRKQKVSTHNFRESILGTLICWRIPLDGVASIGA